MKYVIVFLLTLMLTGIVLADDDDDSNANPPKYPPPFVEQDMQNSYPVVPRSDMDDRPTPGILGEGDDSNTAKSNDSSESQGTSTYQEERAKDSNEEFEQSIDNYDRRLQQDTVNRERQERNYEKRLSYDGAVSQVQDWVNHWELNLYLDLLDSEKNICTYQKTYGYYDESFSALEEECFHIFIREYQQFLNDDTEALSFTEPWPKNDFLKFSKLLEEKLKRFERVAMVRKVKPPKINISEFVALRRLAATYSETNSPTSLEKSTSFRNE